MHFPAPSILLQEDKRHCLCAGSFLPVAAQLLGPQGCSATGAPSTKTILRRHEARRRSPGLCRQLPFPPPGTISALGSGSEKGEGFLKLWERNGHQCLLMLGKRASTHKTFCAWSLSYERPACKHAPSHWYCCSLLKMGTAQSGSSLPFSFGANAIKTNGQNRNVLQV